MSPVWTSTARWPTQRPLPSTSRAARAIARQTAWSPWRSPMATIRSGEAGASAAAAVTALAASMTENRPSQRFNQKGIIETPCHSLLKGAFGHLLSSERKGLRRLGWTWRQCPFKGRCVAFPREGTRPRQSLRVSLLIRGLDGDMKSDGHLSCRARLSASPPIQPPGQFAPSHPRRGCLNLGPGVRPGRKGVWHGS